MSNIKTETAASQNPQVSIVIVCMNNLKNLIPCLDSIYKYTTDISFEILVVAYLFSEENLKIVREKYPEVDFIVNNEYTGFSENNNIALRKSRGKYSFCLNDDTEFVEPVLKQLVADFERLPENAAIVSPIIYLTENRDLQIGRPKMSWVDMLLWQLHIGEEKRGKNYTDADSGLARTWNISGGVFMIKRDLFEQEGWFDEYFFFTPEDIALGTGLRKKGYELYVDHSLHVLHYFGESRNFKMTQLATEPASTKGNLVYFSKGNPVAYALLGFCMTIVMGLRMLAGYILAVVKKRPNKWALKALTAAHCIAAIYSRKTPKQLFIKYFTAIKK